MNVFRRTMLILLILVVFLTGVGLGRSQASVYEVLVAAFFAVVFLFWALSGWDATDTSKAEAIAAVRNMTPELNLKTTNELRTDGKIAAIKLIRAELGLGLMEAKQIVDELDRTSL